MNLPRISVERPGTGPEEACPARSFALHGTTVGAGRTGEVNSPAAEVVQPTLDLREHERVAPRLDGRPAMRRGGRCPGSEARGPPCPARLAGRHLIATLSGANSPVHNRSPRIPWWVRIAVVPSQRQDPLRRGYRRLRVGIFIDVCAARRTRWLVDSRIFVG